MKTRFQRYVMVGLIFSNSGVPIVLPEGPEWHQKVDFAYLEYHHPIPKSALARLTPEVLTSWDQESLDQLYARLPSGPIPQGAYDGRVILAAGDGIGKTIRNSALLNTVISPEKVETLMMMIWKGKVFYPGQGLVRNRVGRMALKNSKFLQRGEVKIPTGRDEIELFPAKLFCGQSLLDARRESIVIDYAHTALLPGYNDKIDYIAGRDGLKIRDEIRMIRPGFYLGRSHFDKVFEINFVLYSREAEAAGIEKSDCWAPGS